MRFEVVGSVLKKLGRVLGRVLGGLEWVLAGLGAVLEGLGGAFEGQWRYLTLTWQRKATRETTKSVSSMSVNPF